MVYQYPLLPELPCFVHPDELLRESKKSSRIHCLKEKIDFSSLSNANTVIAYGMFAVRSTLKVKSSTFASFARHLLIKLLKLTNYRLYLSFDIYKSPSIKLIKRKSRGDRGLIEFYCFGPRQSLPTDFT